MIKVCVMPGDGIGREVIPVAVKVLQAAIPQLYVVEARAGWACFESTGQSVSPEAMAALTDCRAGLFGAVASPARRVEGYRSSILTLRQAFHLFANIRPIRFLPLVSPGKQIDLVLFRENTEDLYIGEEQQRGDVAEAVKRISRAASRRIAQVALTCLQTRPRKKLTIVHKANVLPVTDGLFRDTVLEEVSAHRDKGHVCEVEELLVDVAALKLVSHPESFDVIVAPNLYGDILSDIAAHWMGGLGFAPGLNLGDGIAIAEPVHGSAPDIAGKNMAHPAAAILSGALLARWAWGQTLAAQAIENALHSALQSWGSRPIETRAFGEEVAARVSD